MFDVFINTKNLELNIEIPDRKFWKAVALEADQHIKKRTLAGIDIHGKSFRKYSQEYLEYRIQKKRSRKPNLLFSGRMQGGIRGVGKKDHALIQISGEEGLKAWANEQLGREWFDLDEKQQDEIAKKVDLWLKKRNNLK